MSVTNRYDYNIINAFREGLITRYAKEENPTLGPLELLPAQEAQGCLQAFINCFYSCFQSIFSCFADLCRPSDAIDAFQGRITNTPTMSNVITVIQDLAAFMQTSQGVVTDDQARRALTMVEYSLENHCRHFTESDRRVTGFVGLAVASAVANTAGLGYAGHNNLQRGLRDPTILPPGLTAAQTIEQLVETSSMIREVRDLSTVREYMQARPRSKCIWESVEYVANSYRCFLMDPMQVAGVTLTGRACMQNDLHALAQAKGKSLT